ncbi:MAG: hypothetical protein JNM91_10280 [Flavobacteriales bacterium]|nr:hypothetical protein [Flavobacteriales bacterium]
MTDRCVIRTPVDAVHYRLSDTMGRGLRSGRVNGSTVVLERDQLAPGIYNLVVEGERWQQATRLIVQ